MKGLGFIAFILCDMADLLQLVFLELQSRPWRGFRFYGQWFRAQGFNEGHMVTLRFKKSA